MTAPCVPCPTCGHVPHPATRPLTTKQAAVLRFVERFIAGTGIAPRLEDIATGFGYRSLATAAEHLRALEDKGWIRRAFNRERAIEVLVSLGGADDIVGAGHVE